MSSFVEKMGWHFNYGNNFDDGKKMEVRREKWGKKEGHYR